MSGSTDTKPLELLLAPAQWLNTEAFEALVQWRANCSTTCQQISTWATPTCLGRNCRLWNYANYSSHQDFKKVPKLPIFSSPFDENSLSSSCPTGGPSMVQPANGSRGSCGSSSALRNPRAPLPHIVCRCLRWDPPGPTGSEIGPESWRCNSCAGKCNLLHSFHLEIETTRWLHHYLYKGKNTSWSGNLCHQGASPQHVAIGHFVFQAHQLCWDWAPHWKYLVAVTNWRVRFVCFD